MIQWMDYKRGWVALEDCSREQLLEIIEHLLKERKELEKACEQLLELMP